VNITATYQRNPLGGNDLNVQVTGSANDQMSRVVVELDGFTLSDDVLDEPEESYQKELPGAGSAVGGAEHVLRVTAYDTKGAGHTASRRWVDAS